MGKGGAAGISGCPGEDWAEFILDSTSDYLRACEQYLSLAFPASGGFTIVGEEETLLRGAGWEGSTSGGRFESSTVLPPSAALPFCTTSWLITTSAEAPGWSGWPRGSSVSCPLFSPRRAFFRRESRIARAFTGTGASGCFLPGWLFPGEYGEVGIADFTDRDSDGLLSVEERYLRTNPGTPDTDGDSIPDGAEIDLGLNPFEADAPEIIPRYGPFADGLKGDWGFVSSLSAEDRENDGTRGKEYDLARLSYTVRDSVLWVLVETVAPIEPPANNDFMFDLLIDTDMDGEAECEAAFFLSDSSNRWFYDHAAGGVVDLEGYLTGLNDVIELAVPLEALATGTVRILPIIRDIPGKTNYDEWEGWVRIP